MDLRGTLLLILFNFTSSLHGTEGTQRSCYDNLVDNLFLGVTSQDGVYNVTINGVVTPVYCDMTTDGGGWTLLVAMVEGLNWTLQNILERNEQIPGLSMDYSLLGNADYIKENARGTRYQFALEATGRGRWGGRFSAPTTYSLVNYGPNQTDIQVLTKYDSWNFNGTYSIGKNLPWIDVDHKCALLTTRKKMSGNWYGTLVMKQCDEWSSFGPSPWLGTGSQWLIRIKPIYYWLRENDPGNTETPTLLPISEADVTRRMACDNVTRLVDKDLQTGLTLPGRGGPGCSASFTINVPSNSNSSMNFLVRVFGGNLGKENLIVAHADTQSLPKGWFKLCHVIKHVAGVDKLDFACDMTTPSLLHLVVFAKEDITVTEIAAIRMNY